MILAIGNSLIMPLVAILIIQYCLALYALMRLFKTKPNKLNSVLWNIIIVLLIIIGPVLYIIIEGQAKDKPLDNKTETEDYSDYTI